MPEYRNKHGFIYYYQDQNLHINMFMNRWERSIFKSRRLKTGIHSDISVNTYKKSNSKIVAIQCELEKCSSK